MGEADVQDVRDMFSRETLLVVEKVKILPAGIYKDDDANVQQSPSE